MWDVGAGKGNDGAGAFPEKALSPPPAALMREASTGPHPVGLGLLPLWLDSQGAPEAPGRGTGAAFWAGFSHGFPPACLRCHEGMRWDTWPLGPSRTGMCWYWPCSLSAQKGAETWASGCG